jgi:hypothetical protein
MSALQDNLREATLRSDTEEAVKTLEDLWEGELDYELVLDTIEIASMGAFSHRYATIHVPKEHEYLYRILPKVDGDEQLDFLKMYLEYLCWSAKYINFLSDGLNSGAKWHKDPDESYIDALEDNEPLLALFYINEVGREDLDKALKIILQRGCIDVSQSIGHYFSCTESVVKLAQSSGYPDARNHLQLSTLFLLQSSPLKLRGFEKPEMEVEKILSQLVRTTGFVEYHYMILANGLINQREFIGEDYYQHAFAGLESLLPKLDEGMSQEYLDKNIGDYIPEEASIAKLKENIWNGNKGESFSILRKILEEDGVTDELTTSIAHTFTRIDDHPHDPHYLTFPISAFELTKHMDELDTELLLAHTVEFAVNRIHRYGVNPEPAHI